MVLAFELMDQERLLAAAPLFSSRVIGTANIRRHSWARKQTVTFFPGITETWDDSELRCNFKMSSNSFETVWSTTLFL